MKLGDPKLTTKLNVIMAGWGTGWTLGMLVKVPLMEVLIMKHCISNPISITF